MNDLKNNNTIHNIIKGILKASDIITSTMGGSGKNVLMNQQTNTFTKDGVSVARKIGFHDTQENIGAQLLVNTANQTVKECGDGTTLTSLLTAEFIKSLFEEIKTRPVNEVIEECHLMIKNLEDFLLSKSKKLDSADDIFNVAFTSCKNRNLAELIKNIFIKTGFDAKVSIELSEFSKQTYVEHTEGLSFQEGYVNSLFANRDDDTCVFENPIVLIVNDQINRIEDISADVDFCHQSKKPIVIIAKDFAENVVRYAIGNKKAIGLQICLIKLPGWGESVKENIYDIKSFLTKEQVNRIVVTPYEFTLFNNPNINNIRRRVSQLTKKIDTSIEDWEVEDYKKRIANLQQKSVIIFVGGTTKMNAKEELDRIEDAVGAIQSASKLGVVYGAGSAFLEFAQTQNLPAYLYRVLIRPSHKILENANVNLNPVFFPYNTKTKQIDHSIIDPTLVLIQSVKNAFSLTELLINTEYIIYE